MENPVSLLEEGGMCTYCGCYMQDGNAECSDCSMEIDTFHHYGVRYDDYYPPERDCDCWVNHGLDNPLRCPFHTGVAWIFGQTETLRAWRLLEAQGWTKDLRLALYRCLPKPHSEALDSIRRFFLPDPSRSISVEYGMRLPGEINLSLLHYNSDTHFNFTLDQSCLRMDSGPACTPFQQDPTLNLGGQVVIPTSMTSSLVFKDEMIGETISTARLSDVFFLLLDRILLNELTWKVRISLAKRFDRSASQLRSRRGGRLSTQPKISPSWISYSNQSPAILRERSSQTSGRRYPRRPERSPGSRPWPWLPPSS